MSNIIWKASPNYRIGRNGKKIIAIVNHITAGKMPGCLSWMCNPKADASAHYLVTKKGEIYQLVKDENTAWHAGVVNKPTWSLYQRINPNSVTIGIEHEALAGEAITEAQYQSTLELHKMLCKKWSIPIDRNHIIGHYELDTVNRPNDPGNFPWERLIKDLKGGNTMNEQWKVNIINQALTKGLITQIHNPNEPVEMWALLAVCLNMLKIMEGK